MPTRKQRRRAQKGRRHEYETVWVDEEGNELEEPPEDVGATSDKLDAAKPKAKTSQQRGGRPVRTPQAPSWQRAAKRALLFGVAIVALFYILGAKNGGHNLASALLLGGAYTILFIPFMYMTDRFAYNRWQRREAQQGTKGQASRKR